MERSEAELQGTDSALPAEAGPGNLPPNSYTYIVIGVPKNSNIYTADRFPHDVPATETTTVFLDDALFVPKADATESEPDKETNAEDGEGEKKEKKEKERPHFSLKSTTIGFVLSLLTALAGAVRASMVQVS